MLPAPGCPNVVGMLRRSFLVGGAAAAVLAPAAAAGPALHHASIPGKPAAGKAVFIANCGTCHALKAAGTVGTLGSRLDKTKATYGRIVTVVTAGTSGKIGAMPAYRGQLTRAQILNVAAFVYTSAHR
jgi:mono/diheme cytochrome c family protein